MQWVGQLKKRIFGNDLGAGAFNATRLFRESARIGSGTLAAFLSLDALDALIALAPLELFRRLVLGILLPAQAHQITFVIFGLSLIPLSLLVIALLQPARESCRDRMQSGLRRILLQELHQIALDSIDGARRGDWLNTMRLDLYRIEKFFAVSLPDQARSLAVVLAVNAAFFFVGGWTLGGFSLLVATMTLLMGAWLNARLEAIRRSRELLEAEGISLLNESLEGIRTIRSYGMEPYIQRRFDSRMAEKQSQDQILQNLSRKFSAGDGLLKLTPVLALVAGGVVFCPPATAASGLLMVLFFAFPFLKAARRLGDAVNEWRDLLANTGRLGELLYGKKELMQVVTRLEGLELRDAGAITLKDLTVETSEGCIGPLTVRLARGQVSVLTGPSGAGKSSVLEVVAGLKPAVSGLIRLEDVMGRPLWGTVSRRPRLPLGPSAYVEQFPYIFEGTLRENLLFGNQNRLSDAVLWESLERVSLHELVREFGGLDFKINDRGADLSKGERYRVALCRALLLKRPFLLLDEPFRHLDDATMEIIVEMLRKEKNRTGILISTRFIPKGLVVDSVINLEEVEALHAAERHSQARGLTLNFSQPV